MSRLPVLVVFAAGLMVGALATPAAGQSAIPACNNPQDPACNHLKCYQIKSSKVVTQVVVDNQFGRERLVRLTPVKLCVPTQKTCCDPTVTTQCVPQPCQDPVQPVLPVHHFKCYKELPRKECTGFNPTAAGDCPALVNFAGPTVTLVDQFGTEQVTVGPPLELCVPVLKILSTTTTTPTQTTTTTTIRCGGPFPNCAGSCPGQDVCHPPVGVSTCECCTPTGVPCTAASVCCSGQPCATSGTCP